MRTIALTDGQSVEVISSFSAPTKNIAAVLAEPGWYVIGAFRVPVEAKGRLEVVGILSAAGLTMRVRLYDLTAVAVVGGSLVELAGFTADTWAASGTFIVPGGHVYQVQAEVIGASTGFGTLKSAQLNS